MKSRRVPRKNTKTKKEKTMQSTVSDSERKTTRGSGRDPAVREMKRAVAQKIEAAKVWHETALAAFFKAAEVTVAGSLARRGNEAIQAKTALDFWMKVSRNLARYGLEKAKEKAAEECRSNIRSSEGPCSGEALIVAAGIATSEAYQRLAQQVTALLNPSEERAMTMNEDQMQNALVDLLTKVMNAQKQGPGRREIEVPREMDTLTKLVTYDAEVDEVCRVLTLCTKGGPAFDLVLSQAVPPGPVCGQREYDQTARIATEDRMQNALADLLEALTNARGNGAERFSITLPCGIDTISDAGTLQEMRQSGKGVTLLMSDGSLFCIHVRFSTAD